MKNFIIIDGVPYDADIYAVKAESKEDAVKKFNTHTGSSQILTIFEFEEKNDDVMYVTNISE